MSSSNAYLRLSYRQWQFTRRIPGTNKRLVVNLGTGDIVQARKRRDQVWSEFLRQNQSDEQIALELAEELAGGNEDVHHAVSAREDDWEAKHGTEEAIRLVKIATGRLTPVAAYLDSFVRERPCATTTRLARLTSIKSLPFKFVQDVDVKKAGEYVSQLAQQKNPATVNSRISHLRGYWGFLVAKGLAKSNPWIGQSVRRDRRVKPGSAVWDFEEVRKILTECKPDLRLLFRTLIYSGARCGELAHVRPEHLMSDGFNLTISKTEAGERRVYLPKSLVTALGKQTGEYVFLPKIPAKGARGRPGALSKVLSAELRRLFPQHDTDEQRNSLKTTHGLRKLWVTIAEQEGVPLHSIQAACGHQRTGVTLSVYSAGPSQAQIKDTFDKVARRLDDELMAGA
jgi:integrase